jgi:SAM-dependent methyltransferase
MTEPAIDISGYAYEDGDFNLSHESFVPSLLAFLGSLDIPQDLMRIFDPGCGNGAVAEVLTRHGYQFTGVDVLGHGAERPLGSSLHCGVGSRAYQVLVNGDAEAVAPGSRVSFNHFSSCGPCAHAG